MATSISYNFRRPRRDAAWEQNTCYMEYRVESRHGRYLLLQVNNGATCLIGGWGGWLTALKHDLGNSNTDLLEKAQKAECMQLSQN